MARAAPPRPQATRSVRVRTAHEGRRRQLPAGDAARDEQLHAALEAAVPAGGDTEFQLDCGLDALWTNPRAYPRDRDFLKKIKR